MTPAGELRRLAPGEPLFLATAGGMGLTGVITRMELRLIPVASATMRVTTERAPDLDTLLARLRARDEEFRYSVSWIDCLKRGAGHGPRRADVGRARRRRRPRPSTRRRA